MESCALPFDATRPVLQAIQFGGPQHVLLPRFRLHRRELFPPTLLPSRIRSNAYPFWRLSASSSSSAIVHVNVHWNFYQEDRTIPSLDLVRHGYDDSWIRSVYRFRCQFFMGQDHYLPDHCWNWCWTKLPESSYRSAEPCTSKSSLFYCGVRYARDVEIGDRSHAIREYGAPAFWVLFRELLQPLKRPMHTKHSCFWGAAARPPSCIIDIRLYFSWHS